MCKKFSPVFDIIITQPHHTNDKCYIVNINFSSKYNLKRHIEKKHDWQTDLVICGTVSNNDLSKNTDGNKTNINSIENVLKEIGLVDLIPIFIKEAIHIVVLKLIEKD